MQPEKPINQNKTTEMPQSVMKLSQQLNQNIENLAGPDTNAKQQILAEAIKICQQSNK